MFLLPFDGCEFVTCPFDAVFNALHQAGYIRFLVEFDVTGMIDPAAELFETGFGQISHRHEDHGCHGTGQSRLSGCGFKHAGDPEGGHAQLHGISHLPVELQQQAFVHQDLLPIPETSPGVGGDGFQLTIERIISFQCPHLHESRTT